jgi:hypothetical protein
MRSALRATEGLLLINSSSDSPGCTQSCGTAKSISREVLSHFGRTATASITPSNQFELSNGHKE